MEDVRIIDLFFARSEDALRETEQKYGKYLKKVAYGLLRSPEDTEEILGDTMLAVWNSIPPERPGKLKYYLARIARNLSLNRLKYQSAQCRCSTRDLLLSELEDCIPDRNCQDRWEAKEIGDALNRFLKKLSREDCGLFLRRYFYGDTLSELETQFGLPEYKIRYRLKQTRGDLAAFLLQEGIGI